MAEPVSAGALVPATKGPIAHRLEEHARHARGALSPNTERALRSDLAIFTGWCAERGEVSLPAHPEAVAAFIDAMAERGRKPATVKRYVASIATYHRAAKLDSPTATEAVRLAIRRMARAKGLRQDQVAPLSRSAVDRILSPCGSRTADLRNAALLAIAYDTLARRSELVSMDLADLEANEDGSATVLIRRSKSDQVGQGHARYLAPDTVALVNAWIRAAQLTDGALFRRVYRSGRIGARLEAPSVAAIFRDMAERTGIDSSAISAHSTRIGAAQDAVAAGLELAEVMQMGGWKTPAMVARYSERLLANRGGAAKLAAMQGRATKSGREP